MTGFPNACSYSYGGTGVEISEDTETATTGDQFAWTCGYYVIY